MAIKVSGIINEEHKRLYALLAKAIINKSKEAFLEFKWYFEKHIFAEEKAIYESFQEISGEEVNEVFELLEEHSKLNFMINQIESNSWYEEESKLKELEKEILGHENSEKDFYLMLDETLTENEIKEIIDKFQEVIRA